MVGFGYDSHRLEIGKTLIIGGINIESDFGCVAHSDGDVLLHALTDAFLGACGAGDIGELFPDSDNKWKDAPSYIFVEKAMDILREKNLEIVNIDSVIIAEKPKLSPYKNMIKKNIAKLCSLPDEAVNIKAKTNEKMGFVGRMEGIVAYCICQVEKRQV